MRVVGVRIALSLLKIKITNVDKKASRSRTPALGGAASRCALGMIDSA